LAMVVVCNSNDAILFNTNWEVWLKSGGLDYFRIYIHLIKCKKKKKNVQKDLSLFIWWKVWDFFFFFLLQYLKEVKVCSSCN
jgi:hypothetical protein